MKKLFLFIMTSLFWVVLVQAQDLDNSDKHAFEIKRNVALNGCTQRIGCNSDGEVRLCKRMESPNNAG
jgi:hypothetical protein